MSRKPSVEHLHVFGCRAYVHIQDKRKGLQPKSEHCIFLGYPLEFRGWKCYNPATKKVVISRDVVFVETELPGLGLGGTSGPAYKPLVSKPDAGGVGSAPDKPLSFNLGSGSDNDDSDDDDTPGPGSSSSAPGSVSAAPDNRATDPLAHPLSPGLLDRLLLIMRVMLIRLLGLLLLLGLLCVALHASKSLQSSFGSFLRIGLLLLQFLKLMTKYLSLMMMPLCI